MQLNSRWCTPGRRAGSVTTRAIPARSGLEGEPGRSRPGSSPRDLVWKASRVGHDPGHPREIWFGRRAGSVTTRVIPARSGLEGEPGRSRPGSNQRNLHPTFYTSWNGCAGVMNPGCDRPRLPHAANGMVKRLMKPYSVDGVSCVTASVSLVVTCVVISACNGKREVSSPRWQLSLQQEPRTDGGSLQGSEP